MYYILNFYTIYFLKFNIAKFEMVKLTRERKLWSRERKWDLSTWTSLNNKGTTRTSCTYPLPCLNIHDPLQHLCHRHQTPSLLDDTRLTRYITTRRPITGESVQCETRRPLPFLPNPAAVPA
jgi:hypothetical protein